MEFMQVVKERYSCKKYNPDKTVPEEALNQILEAGRLAPTARNLQEQRIYVIKSEEKLKIIDSHTPCRYGAPVVILVAFDKDNVYTYPGSERQSGIEDATIVATHMILAAKDAGVESCWLNRFNPEALKKDLALPENEEILMLMDVGYAAEDAGPLPNHFSRKELSETVKYL